MSDAKQVMVGGVPISLKDEAARNSIGNLANLNTTAKNNLVAAINEAAQSGSGEGSDPEAVKYTSQSLEESQKAQARTNIGAGTYSKPSGGIPASDLASGAVPDVSGLYTKPASGIPASDLASGVIPDISGKQDTLVSGTNIKTINQTSLLGSGDITIEDGVGFESAESPTPADGTIIITLTNGDTMTLDLNHEHPQYYSKLVETSQPQGGFLPDVIYKLGTLTGSVTFALAAAVTGNANHYFIVFDTGSTAPTIVWPSGLTWVDGSAPAPSANKHCEVSIMDGIAAYLEV